MSMEKSYLEMTSARRLPVRVFPAASPAIAASELLLAFAIAFAAMFALRISGASAGEVTICSQDYGSVYNKHDKSDWVYRVVDGKKCWFPANGMKRGRQKPLDELRWPSSETAAPVSIPTDPDPAKMQAPWDMEHRWQGDK